MELKKNAKKANAGENVSGTSGHVEGVEKKSGSPSYSHSSATSEDEEEILEEPPKKAVEEPPKKPDHADVKNTAGFDWYKLTDKDGTQFANRVNRHASSHPDPNLIMLAI